MSIITRALQKAQSMRSGKQSEEETFHVSFSGGPSPGTDAPGQKRAAPRKVRHIVIIGATVLILGVSAVFLLYDNRPLSTPTLPAAREPAPVPTAHKDLPADTEEANNQTEDKSAFEKTADIFAIPRGSVSFSGTKTPPVLNGIMYSPALPQAVINGVVVSEGDVIDGFVVLKIFPKNVTVVSDGKEFELKLR
jgi:hypothetical protein